MDTELLGAWRIAVWRARCELAAMDELCIERPSVFFELWYGCLIDEGK